MTSATYNSPAGNLMLVANGDALLMCDWIDEYVGESIYLTQILNNKNYERNYSKILSHVATSDTNLLDDIESEQNIISQTRQQLSEYFAGERFHFDIPIAPIGTEFQQEVWRELQYIPYGTTLSYSDIARSIGRPRSVRAVANAIGANPISIIIPCHRVIGADGTLTGYAGGLQAKTYLLLLELTANR